MNPKQSASSSVQEAQQAEHPTTDPKNKPQKIIAENVGGDEDTDEAEQPRLIKGDPNLFVRPWVALWRCNDKSAVINLDWEEDHPRIAGRKIKASWRVTGDPQLGLPTPGDRRLFNVLCELTREQGMSQVVSFTRYDVLKRLGRSSGQYNYELLLHSFKRLQAVSITARNVFRDARTGLIQDTVFSIIDDVTIVRADKPDDIRPDEPQLSTFTWSDRIYNNIRNGFLLTFDLNIAQSLHSDVALVLYPLLLAQTYDGPGRRRSRFHSELRDFYENHLGMRSTPYVSKMEERLRPGHEELKQIGFLLDVRIEPMKSRSAQAPAQHKITYILKVPEAEPEQAAPEPEQGPPPLRALEGVLRRSDVPDDSEGLGSASGPLRGLQGPLRASKDRGDARRPSRPGDEPLPNAPPAPQVLEPPVCNPLFQRMVDIGVDASAARQVLEQHGEESARLQLDCLSDRSPRDPAALFLYAVRRDLGPPAAYLDRVEQDRREEAVTALSATSRQEAQAAAVRARADREEVRRSLGSATAFYEGLCDEAKALVRYQVSAELRQGGVKGRWQYPQPLWMEVLVGLLRDDEWRQKLEQMRDEPEPEILEHPEKHGSQTEPVQPTVVLARLDLYADMLRAMVKSGEVAISRIDSLKESAFPLLDAEEWQAVKALAQSSF